MNAKNACALVLAILFLIVFWVAVGQGVPALPATAPQLTIAGAAMWKGRTFEVILQGLIILSGVIAILLLLRTDTSREMRP
jgi:Na+/pantothenate symporter